MIKRRIAVACLLPVLLAASCEDTVREPPEAWQVDKDEQTAVFFRCLEHIPDGPKETKYNDWDEVVDECRSSAYYLALYCYQSCPPGARTIPPSQKREETTDGR